MAKIIKVEDLKNLIKNLDDNKEILITDDYLSSEPKVELIKELKPVGEEYYKITL